MKTPYPLATRRRRLYCVVCALGALAVAYALGLLGRAEAAFLKGPHLQDVRTDRITIVWEQETAGGGTVVINGNSHPSSTAGTIHEVVISGLVPATTYTYSVTADGTSAGGTFHTAPSDPLAPFNFIAWGDNRSFHNDHQVMVDALIADAPADFIVNTGDMVASGEIGSDWQFFFDIEYLLIKDTPWFPVVGNHEEDAGQLPIFFTDYLAPPTDTSGSEAYYSFTYANSAFVMLDGHVNVSPQPALMPYWDDFSSAQKAWLNTVLAQYAGDPRIQHVFVFAHVPPYSSKSGRTGSHALRLLLPTLQQYGVDAIVCGHDHYLERGASPDGLPYFTIGGGGAPRYANDSEGNLGWKIPMALPWLDDGHYVHFALASLGYARFSVNNGQVDVEIKDATGAILDTVSWNTGDVTPGPDAGVADAAVPSPDGTLPGADGSSPGPDAGVNSGPGGDPGQPRGGCACRAGGGPLSDPAPPGALLLVLFLLLRRRF